MVSQVKPQAVPLASYSQTIAAVLGAPFPGQLPTDVLGKAGSEIQVLWSLQPTHVRDPDRIFGSWLQEWPSKE